MKTFFLTCAIALSFLAWSPVSAKNYYTKQDGNWTNKNTWQNKDKPGNWLSNNDTIFVNHDIKLNANAQIGHAVVIVSQNSELETSGNRTFTLNYFDSYFFNYGECEFKNIKIWGGHFVNYNEISTEGFTASGNNIYITNEGEFSIEDDVTIYTCNFTNNGELKFEGSLNTDATFINNGSLEIEEDFKNNWSGNFTNNGSIEVKGSCTNEKTFTNKGSIAIESNFTNGYSGVFSNEGTLNIDGDFTNYKTFSNTSAGSCTIEGAVENSWSCTLNNAGYISFKGNIDNKGSISNSDTLIIYATFTNSSSSSEFDNTGKFLLYKSGNNKGTFINYGNSTDSGEVEMELFLKGGEWHYVATPLKNVSSNVFMGAALYSYDESTSAWKAIGSNETLDPMVGYDVYFQNDKTIKFKGQIVDGKVELSNLTFGSDSFHLVGNPYLSTIDWKDNSWVKTNLENAIYVWDPVTQNITSYVNGSGVNGGSRYIPAGQAFFVKVKPNHNNGGRLVIDKYAQIDNNSVNFRSEETSPDVLRLKVTAENGFSDETIVRFNSNASQEFDADFDAHKIAGYNHSVPQLYSMSADQKKLSINTLGEFNDMITMPLNLKPGMDGSYRISARLEDFPECMSVYIEDLKTGEIYDLLAGEYEFDASVNDAGGRFIIYFSRPKSIDANTDMNQTTAIAENESNSRTFCRNQSIFVQIDDFASANNISVYDLKGAKVATTQIADNLTQINVGNKGIYIVNITYDNGTTTSSKVVIDY